MSLPATLPVLPIEVIEHALDYLRGDRKTLATCRLVCRAWSARARYNLFYIVKICLTNAVRFFAAVERDPDAAYAMHELTLEAMWDNPKGASPYLGTANLRTLRLSIMDLHSPWLPRVMQCATHSLTELSMRTCAIADTHQLVRFLQLLPRLKHFAGTHLIITAHDDTPEKYPIEAFPALQSLCLLGDCSRGVPLRLLCAFTSASGGLKSMSVLTIKLRTHELATFNDLLVLVAANLRELVLTVQPDESETLPSAYLHVCATMESNVCLTATFRWIRLPSFSLGMPSSFLPQAQCVAAPPGPPDAQWPPKLGRRLLREHPLRQRPARPARCARQPRHPGRSRKVGLGRSRPGAFHDALCVVEKRRGARDASRR